MVTVLGSLFSAKGRAQNAVSGARRHAAEYLDVEKDPQHRESLYRKLLGEEAEIRKLPEKYRARIREEDKLMDLLRRAHETHDAGTGAARGSGTNPEVGPLDTRPTSA